jgi:TrmH family RNA methyltransferase
MELSKTKKSLFASLSQSKMRKKHSLFIAEGEKSVSDLLSAFTPEAIIVSKDYKLTLDIGDTPCYTASNADLKEVSNLSTPSDIIAVFRMPEADSVYDIDSSRLYLMLDGVQDPGNLGTIIRTCHWFGIFDIIASRDTVDCFNPKTVQATMGSLGRVRVRYANLPEIVSKHPEMPVYGLLLDGENIFNAGLRECGFIVMGNEGNGISAEMRKLVTDPLLIPPATADHGESLNVAIATAITLAQFRPRSTKFVNAKVADVPQIYLPFGR